MERPLRQTGMASVKIVAFLGFDSACLKSILLNLDSTGIAAYGYAMNGSKKKDSESNRAEPIWLAIVREQVEKLSFGTVQITVHNGRVTQVDATVRTRLEGDGQTVAGPDPRSPRAASARI